LQRLRCGWCHAGLSDKVREMLPVLQVRIILFVAKKPSLEPLTAWGKTAFSIACQVYNAMDALHFVHAIELGNVKAFIIEGEKNILVDTGVKPVPEDILSFFERGGINWGCPAGGIPQAGILSPHHEVYW